MSKPDTESQFCRSKPSDRSALTIFFTDDVPPHRIQIPTAKACMSSVSWRISTRRWGARSTIKQRRWILRIISSKAVKQPGTGNFGGCCDLDRMIE